MKNYHKFLQSLIRMTIARCQIYDSFAAVSLQQEVKDYLPFTSGRFPFIGWVMVRDNFLMLPGWFTRDDINDIIFSICVSQCAASALI